MSAAARSISRTTTDAIAQGIETIYQDSALVTQLSIARNLFLGRGAGQGTAPPEPDGSGSHEPSRAICCRRSA